MTDREFNKEEELELIKNRYERIVKRFPLTIAVLKKSLEFSITYKNLLDSGLKDWHILLGIANVTMNYRVNYENKSRTLEDVKKAYIDMSERIETENDIPVPLGEYSFDNIQFNLDNTIATYLVQKGFQLKTNTPNFEKLRAYANKKYHYFKLDIAHDPIFIFDD